MSLPDKCPNCDAAIHRRETSGTRIYFACESWMNEGSEKPTWRSNSCWDKQAIREAATIIREMMDEWGNAMDSDMLDKAEEWLKDNEP